MDYLIYIHNHTHLRTVAIISRCCGTWEVWSIKGVSDLMQLKKARRRRFLSSTTDLEWNDSIICYSKTCFALVSLNSTHSKLWKLLDNPNLKENSPHPLPFLLHLYQNIHKLLIFTILSWLFLHSSLILSIDICFTTTLTSKLLGSPCTHKEKRL